MIKKGKKIKNNNKNINWKKFISMIIKIKKLE